MVGASLSVWEQDRGTFRNGCWWAAYLLLFTSRHLAEHQCLYKHKEARTLLVRKLPEWVEKMPGGAHIGELGWNNGV